MKKFLLSILLTLLASAASYSRGFTAELSTVNSFNRDDLYNGCYNGLKLNAGYQFDFINRLYVEPQLGVSWLYHKVERWPGMSWKSSDPTRESSVDFDAGVIGGVRLCRYVAFITGPEVDVELYHRTIGIKLKDHLTQAWWRFGLDLSVWRLRLRATVNVGMNKPYSNYNRNDSYTIGVGWHF